MLSFPFKRDGNRSLKIDLAKLNNGRGLFSSFVCQLPGKTVRASICEHFTKLRGLIAALGEIRFCELHLQYGETDYCLFCLAEKTIRCAWCGKPIFVGDPVTACPSNPDIPIPDYAVFVRQNPPILVGCLRPECCSKRRSNGFWWPNGFHLGQVDTIDWKVLQKSEAVLTD